MNANSKVTTLANPSGATSASVATASAAPAPEAQGIAGGDNGVFCGRKALLTIGASNDETGTQAVFVSVSGVPFQIPRGKPWLVPVEVVGALQCAVETRYLRDPITGVIQTVDAPRYTFVAQEQLEPVAA